MEKSAAGGGGMHGSGGPAGQLAISERRRRVEQLVHDRMSGDIAATTRHFVEDVELNYNCGKIGLFPAGQWRGRDALRENLRRTDIEYEPLDSEILSIIVEGDRTALRWVSGWRHRATGRAYQMDMAHFLRWRNGLVSEMNEFVDVHTPSHGVGPSISKFEDLLCGREPGLTRDEIARLVFDLCNFSAQGPNVALFRELCAPDVVCEFVGDRRTISYAGRHRGIGALVNIIRGIGVDFEQLGYSMPEVVIEGGCAAARRTVEWRHRGTGRRGIVELADFTCIENGKIVEIVEFRDSVALLQMQD